MSVSTTIISIIIIIIIVIITCCGVFEGLGVGVYRSRFFDDRRFLAAVRSPEMSSSTRSGCGMGGLDDVDRRRRQRRRKKRTTAVTAAVRRTARTTMRGMTHTARPDSTGTQASPRGDGCSPSLHRLQITSPCHPDHITTINCMPAKAHLEGGG